MMPDKQNPRCLSHPPWGCILRWLDGDSHFDDQPSLNLHLRLLVASDQAHSLSSEGALEAALISAVKLAGLQKPVRSCADCSLGSCCANCSLGRNRKRYVTEAARKNRPGYRLEGASSREAVAASTENSGNLSRACGEAYPRPLAFAPLNRSPIIVDSMVAPKNRKTATVSVVTRCVLNSSVCSSSSIVPRPLTLPAARPQPARTPLGSCARHTLCLVRQAGLVSVLVLVSRTVWSSPSQTRRLTPRLRHETARPSGSAVKSVSVP